MLDRQLDVFRAVMETGSATLAARQLGMSQPSVSRHLAQLQESTGLTLFRRQSGKLVPTPSATSLHQEAVQTLASIDRFLNLTERLRAHDAGVLRVAAPNSFCEAFLPQVIARLVERHRNLRYSVEIARYRDIEQMLARREVDLGILRAPVTREGMSTEPLVACPAVCALPLDHPLTRQPVVNIEDLAAQPLILLGRNTPPRLELDAHLRRARKVPVVRMDTRSVGAACGFVACGLGVAVLPELLAVQFAGRRLALRPLEHRILHEFVIASPAGAEHGLLHEFVSEARALTPGYRMDAITAG